MPKPRPLQVLLAVFDQAASVALCDHLRGQGCICDLAETAQQMEAMLHQQTPDLVLIELAPAPTSGPGSELAKDAFPLEHFRNVFPAIPVVALAAPHPDTYFRAAKSGVEAVLGLPLDSLDYVPKLEAACTHAQAQIAGSNTPNSSRKSAQRPPEPLSEARAAAHIPSLFATSEDMAEVRELIEKVAPTSATVLLKGESGVGKELAARLIHSRSARSGHAFVKVNCAAIPNELLESELFGYETGAFTGAVKGKPGKFELADGGTIFLDEIGELHPVLQAKLLHVLQDGEFARLGAKRDTAVDVRVICATNKLLDVLVANGQFREDLFYRINVVTVSLPPLRSRTSEIPVLVDFFLARYASIYSKPLVPLGDAAIQTLMAYHWPGNIRELENLCKRYVIVGGIEQILRELGQRQERRQPLLLERAQETSPRPLELVTASAAEPPSLLEIGRRAAWAAERDAIQKMLAETHWNRREAARRLGVSYKALLNKIAQMEYELADHKVASK